MNSLSPTVTDLRANLEQQNKSIEITMRAIRHERALFPEAIKIENQQRLNDIHQIYVTTITRALETLKGQAESNQTLLGKIKEFHPDHLENFSLCLNQSQSSDERFLEVWSGIEQDMRSMKTQMQEIGVRSYSYLLAG